MRYSLSAREILKDLQNRRKTEAISTHSSEQFEFYKLICDSINFVLYILHTLSRKILQKMVVRLFLTFSAPAIHEILSVT